MEKLNITLEERIAMKQLDVDKFAKMTDEERSIDDNRYLEREANLELTRLQGLEARFEVINKYFEKRPKNVVFTGSKIYCSCGHVEYTEKKMHCPNCGNKSILNSEKVDNLGKRVSMDYFESEDTQSRWSRDVQVEKDSENVYKIVFRDNRLRVKSDLSVYEDVQNSISWNKNTYEVNVSKDSPKVPKLVWEFMLDYFYELLPEMAKLKNKTLIFEECGHSKQSELSALILSVSKMPDIVKYPDNWLVLHDLIQLPDIEYSYYSSNNYPYKDSIEETFDMEMALIQKMNTKDKYYVRRFMKLGEVLKEKGVQFETVSEHFDSIVGTNHSHVSTFATFIEHEVPLSEISRLVESSERYFSSDALDKIVYFREIYSKFEEAEPNWMKLPNITNKTISSLEAKNNLKDTGMTKKEVDKLIQVMTSNADKGVKLYTKTVDRVEDRKLRAEVARCFDEAVLINDHHDALELNLYHDVMKSKEIFNYS